MMIAVGARCSFIAAKISIHVPYSRSYVVLNISKNSTTVKCFSFKRCSLMELIANTMTPRVYQWNTNMSFASIYHRKLSYIYRSLDSFDYSFILHTHKVLRRTHLGRLAVCFHNIYYLRLSYRSSALATSSKACNCDRPALGMCVCRLNIACIPQRKMCKHCVRNRIKAVFFLR